ncbi:MAG TPA: DUF2948 family protein [Thermohalobaculum sp.]|nr:DUF2948 family protein [Thermohalobaculum sp.]
MTDARFEDAPYSDRPLKLRAESEDDLAVISSLVQDAVGKTADIHWLAKKHRVVLMLNRFRWENHIGDRAGARACERVRTALTLEAALRVRARGLDPRDGEQVFELLALLFQPRDGPSGTLILTMAGGAELAVEVECLELSLADLSRPWAARARTVPAHQD